MFLFPKCSFIQRSCIFLFCMLWSCIFSPPLIVGEKLHYSVHTIQDCNTFRSSPVLRRNRSLAQLLVPSLHSRVGFVIALITTTLRSVHTECESRTHAYVHTCNRLLYPCVSAVCVNDPLHCKHAFASFTEQVATQLISLGLILRDTMRKHLMHIQQLTSRQRTFALQYMHRMWKTM